MECKSCGSPLMMEDEYCPFCGAKNESAARHIEDMRHYNREFTRTQQKVLKESKWYSRYLAVMLAIVLAAVANVAVIVIAQEAYTIQHYVNKWYHQSHREETMAMLREWEENGDYARIKMYYDKTGFAGLKDAEEFIPVITAYGDMENLRAYMVQISLKAVTDSRRKYDYDDGYEFEWAADCITNLYKTFSHENYKWYERAYEGIHLENLEEMADTVGMWLKTYFYFTDEDIEMLPGMQKYEVLSLIDRRSSEHE
ncbi:MAG: zinc ribbon domain-containing protein [Lachnospiraceae bacterium]|nr:zinc ribbon domain-containing protein [Lachnospiraceae bacterium]